MAADGAVKADAEVKAEAGAGGKHGYKLKNSKKIMKEFFYEKFK